MSIRSFLITLALLVAAPLAAAAQTAPAAAPAAPPASAPAQPHHHVRYLSAVRSLGLTPEQQQQIDGFVRERRTANAGADAPTRHANAKKFRHEIAGVLTPDQRAQLRAAMHAGTAVPAQQ